MIIVQSVILNEPFSTHDDFMLTMYLRWAVNSFRVELDYQEGLVILQGRNFQPHPLTLERGGEMGVKL